MTILSIHCFNCAMTSSLIMSAVTRLVFLCMVFVHSHNLAIFFKYFYILGAFVFVLIYIYIYIIILMTDSGQKAQQSKEFRLQLSCLVHYILFSGLSRKTPSRYSA